MMLSVNAPQKKADPKPVIRYSQCWEDTELLLSALEIKKTDTVISITSGGCNTLSLLSEMPDKIYAVDTNSAQSALLELKLAAIKQLEYNEVSKLFGIDSCEEILKIYEKLIPFLSPEAERFWSSNTNRISRGIIHSGKFEAYLHFFRKYIHPLIHSKRIISELLTIENKKAQREFYDTCWNNRRWRMIFKIFFSKIVMKHYGRSKEMFSYNEKNKVGNDYLKRTEKAISEGNVSSNRYLEYILKGNYITSRPYYLSNDIFRKIKTSSPPQIVTSDLLSFLKTMPIGSVNKFNLSDVFESLSQEHTNAIFQEIVRVALTGARLLFWNNLVRRDIPDHLKSFFIRESALIESLKKNDKIFFYSTFMIYTIQK